MLVEASQTAASASVTGAIQKAARLTGTSFQYLLATARVESNLNPSAAAKTSSAGGLFQFIEQTWLGTLKEAGPSLGYGRYADAISQTRSGRFAVSDPRVRAQIMALRQDPTANALMAGAFTQSNAAALSQKLGRAPNDGELYIAHFLGANGAAKLIQSSPSARAADAFPGAARANRSIFFDKHGRARNAAEVSAVLANKFQVAAARNAPMAAAPVALAQPAAAMQVAAAQPQAMETIYGTQGTERVRPVITIRPVSASAGPIAGEMPGTANMRVTRAYEALNLAALPYAAMPVAPMPAQMPIARAPDASPAPNAPRPIAAAPVTPAVARAQAASAGEHVFHNPYRERERRAAVAPAVNDLWAQAAANVARVRALQAGRAVPAASAAQPSASVETSPQPQQVAALAPAREGRPLGLFQDHRPNARALFGS